MKSNPQSSALFNNHLVINCRGNLLSFAGSGKASGSKTISPKVMGILNITPDSFYDGGKFTEEKAIITQAGKMLSQGAHILDLGAQSTRPGARMVSETAELKRLLPALNGILDKFPEAVISVDTFRARVASQCVEHGAAIINDVSGGELDKNMFDTVARLNVPYVLMHMQGTPATMQRDPVYKDVVAEVFAYLLKKISKLRKAGVKDIVVDPGFGFGKTVAHNYSLLNNLDTFTLLGCPVLAGFSRKSMICKVLKVNPDKALNGTTALNMTALLKGASLLRVHDVKEAVEVVKIFEAMNYQDS